MNAKDIVARISKYYKGDEPMYYIAFNGDDFQGFFESVCGDEIDEPDFLERVFDIVDNDYTLESRIDSEINMAVARAVAILQDEYNNNHKEDSE